MLLEDRVITTDSLKEASSGLGPWCLVAPAVLDRLEPMGTHVLIASGPVMGEEEPILRCSARLRVRGEREALEYQVLLRLDDFIELPTAFDVLMVASDLAAGVAGEIDTWLAG